ncbi:hypothetical protein XELAEV_18012713mg [Xenopus laevis]|uniref:Uncharacterized protein n=1 Tax=Xenopus laevis TaxID=8355 RepID=A0A974HYN7_XENLA|nr:hypothetical protein XELAEV_18012713mg [Xenopus laevis]
MLINLAKKKVKTICRYSNQSNSLSNYKGNSIKCTCIHDFLLATCLNINLRREKNKKSFLIQILHQCKQNISLKG